MEGQQSQIDDELLNYILKHEPKVGYATIYIQQKNGLYGHITFPSTNISGFNENIPGKNSYKIVFMIERDSSHYYPFNRNELINMYKYYTEQKIDKPVTLQMVKDYNKAHDAPLLIGIIFLIILPIIILNAFILKMIKKAFGLYSGESLVTQMIKARRKGIL